MLGPLVARPRKRTGRPPVDNRRVLNGVLYVLNTGCAWMDMPREYGAYATSLAPPRPVVRGRDTGASLAITPWHAR
ncbi:MAG: transposase [Ardenticatenales bacterium]|nr:transposase [Ardenticatenales bacterium]